MDFKIASEAISQALGNVDLKNIANNSQIDFTATGTTPEELAALTKQF